jgi:RNA polymerase sigma factor (sigma-70 family)
MVISKLEVSSFALMSSPAVPTDLLTQFLESDTYEESERLLGRLVSEVSDPVVKRIVLSRMPASHGEDVRQDVLADLVTRLREWKKDANGAEIRDFKAYAAVAARNRCDARLRERFPQRYRLERQLRYLLNKDQRFALWETPAGTWMAGRQRSVPVAVKLLKSSPATTWRSSQETAKLLERIFFEAGGAILFRDLVERVAHQWGIEDQPDAELAECRLPGGNIQTDLENRAWLKRLWEEVAQLPLRQRVALLLNLRDDQGGPALALLPLTGVAKFRDIAATLDIDPEELAGMWKDLPWEDQKIADRLGLNRQQISNMRAAARERLSRRLG